MEEFFQESRVRTELRRTLNRQSGPNQQEESRTPSVKVVLVTGFGTKRAQLQLLFQFRGS